jgi:hypothetical protein
MANVPDYWFGPPAVLQATAGMHRIAWDLRYPDPPILNYGYSGNLLDYREYTLNWHALPGRTPRSTLVGPMVVPGTYTARLAVGGRTYSQPVSVVADPRVSVSAGALESQFGLQQRMVAGITATYQAFQYIEQLRAAGAARVVDAAGKPAAAPIRAAAQALDAALAPLASGPAGVGVAHRDLSRRLNDMLIGDVDPTPSVIAGVDGPCAAIDTSLAELRRIQSGAVSDLNAMLGRAGLSALPSWTPTPRPACTAR